ncbi:unnamed protein product [Acanthoscelides obtectus]|nr:unnamed protein product [Acanthoscelides obtectus]CAK1674922.1 Nuclear pore complex protein Nup98-Nup96 [Acanthoscelides obtectus]
MFNTSSAFGQQNKPGFGFGAQTAQPSLFGQQPQQQASTGLFQSTSSNLFGGTSAFGGQQQQQVGTVIKFNPVTGTDTMMKNGVAQSINTKHHSITCMKEYENKSFEELRLEDYAANRKGPQQQSGFGSTPFGAPASTAPSLFGQTDAQKSAFGQSTGFGQTTSTFGQNTSFGLGTQQQSGGLFNKPTAFGAPTSTTSTFGGFGNTTTSANPFGATAQAKPFGSTTQPLFGSNTTTTQSTGFGTGLFGQTNTQNTAGSLFGKPAQTATGFGQTNTGFAFPAATSTQSNTLFQNKSLFGSTNTTPGFGQSNTFGTNATPFGSSFGKPTTSAFGTGQTTGFGNVGVQPQGTSLFGNTTAKPSLFGGTATPAVYKNPFITYNQSLTGLGLGQQQPLQQQMFPAPEQQSTGNLALLTSDPFGDAPHLAGLEPKMKDSPPSFSATNPKELKSLLDASKKVDSSSHTKLKTVPIKSVKDSLFDGISPSTDYVKTNCRRLIFKHRPNSQGDGNSPRASGLDILSQLNTSQNENKNNLEENENETEKNNKPSSGLRTNPLKLSFENSVNNDETNLSISGGQTYILNTSLVKNNAGLEKLNTSAELDLIDDDPHSSTQVAPKEHPCGIVCTRPEYYTLPSLDELPNFMDENGRCIVKGFTIGRKGYGNVYFPDEMDITGLNIDELVHFRYREINVYPDDSKKPPVGKGLNRRAQVTLDNVYPRRLGTNTLIKDTDELLQMNFAEKLRKVTMKKGAKFVDFRPETGSWVFKVDHFSRYGYDDSDEEAEANAQNGGAKKKPESVLAKKPVDGAQQKPDDNRLSKTGETKEKEPSKELLEVPHYAMDDDSLILHETDQNLLQQSMYVDRITDEDFFAIPNEIPEAYDRYRTAKSIQVMKSTLFTDDRSSDAGSHVSIIRQYLDIPEVEEMPLQRPVLKEDVMVPKRRGVLRPKVLKVYNFERLETSAMEIPTRCLKDMSMFKGKSFKVGWMKGFNFYALNSKDDEINGQLSVNAIECGNRDKKDVLQECLESSLEVVLEESSYETDSENIPTFKVVGGDSYLKKQTELFRDTMRKFENEHARYLHSIWTLAEVLWGPADGDDSVSYRRHLLSEWLKFNTDVEDTPSTTDTTQQLFNHLSRFKICEAASLAIEKHHPKLSLLISQLSLTNETAAFLQEQIEMWYKNLSAKHISKDTKKIYLLLAGIPHKDEENIFEDIDWKRAFSMHLWYICPAGAPIEAAIDLYKKAFEEYGYAEAPNPCYKSTYDGSAFDILFHLLMAYRSRIHRLSDVLNPATHTDDLLDYRLSWLLLQLFLSLNVGIISAAEITKLCVSFSNQLETLGQWEWAIFALLYLEDSSLKKNLIMGILDRNLSPEVNESTKETENFLVNKLHVPSEWIHTVKAEKTLPLGRFFEAYVYYAYAGDYVKANDIFVEHLMPNLFINEQYDVIKFLVNHIRPGADEILQWDSEVGLFSDFLELQEKVISSESDDLLRLQMQLQSINERIPHYRIKTDQQKLCIAEMSKRCASLFKLLHKQFARSFAKSAYHDFIENLVMPPDFEQSEAFQLIDKFDNFMLST